MKKMKNLISEEIKRMIYLSSHQRGVIISEQTENIDDKNKISGIPDWNQGTTGDINMNGQKKNYLTINAQGIKYKDYSNLGLGFGTGLGKSLPEWIKIEKPGKPPQKEPPKRTTYSFIDSTFPYPDNIISPNFKTFPDAADLYYSCVDSLADNIINYGLDSIKEIIFQGSADSMRPTEDIPSGYAELDHTKVLFFESPQNPKSKCSKLYCGLPGGKNNVENMYERNQFLADKRAGTMVVKLLNDVSIKVANLDKKNIDITYGQRIKDELLKKVKLEKGKNYYDGNAGRRGEKSVEITIVPSQDKITPGGITAGTEGETVYIKIAPPVIVGTIKMGGKELSYLGSAEDETGNFYHKILNDENAQSVLGNLIPNLSELGKLNGKSVVTGEIFDDGRIRVDNLIWGELIDHKEHDMNFVLMYESTETVLCAVKILDKFIRLREHKIILANLDK